MKHSTGQPLTQCGSTSSHDDLHRFMYNSTCEQIRGLQQQIKALRQQQRALERTLGLEKKWDGPES